MVKVKERGIASSLLQSHASHRLFIKKFSQVLLYMKE